MLAVLLSLTMCVSIVVPVLAATAMTCGTPEHTHTSACYEKTAVPTCELEELEAGKGEVKVVGTKTETVVNEETGETEEVEVPVYEVVAGHTHGAACYAEEAVLVCKIEAHTHDKDCYGRDGEEVDMDKDKVAPPTKFDATTEVEDEEGNKTTITAKVEVLEGGKLLVDGKEVEGSVTVAEVTKPEIVGTTIGNASETTSKELSRVENDDGTITVETEYTTTYTTKVTTGCWVTYTVTYKVPTTYSIDSEKTSGNLDVTANADGTITVNGINGKLELTDEKGKTFEVTKGEDGKFYVEIGGEPYEVVPDTETKNEDGNYVVSWSFAEDVTPSYNVTEKVDEIRDLPEGMTIKDGKVTLPKDGMTLNGTTFVVEDGKTYVVDGDKKYEVTLTATQDKETLAYTLSWSYTVTTTVRTESKLPENVTVAAGQGNSIVLKDANGNVIAMEEVAIEGKTVTSVATSADGKNVQVTCKDKNGSIYVYVVNVEAAKNETGTGYDVTYQMVSSVEKTGQPSEAQQAGIDQAKKELGGNSKKESEQYEFIAIVLPDGKYVEVARGSKGDIYGLIGGETKGSITVKVEGDKIVISYTDTRSGNGHTAGEQKHSKQFPGLPEGCTIEDIVYSSQSVNSESERIDYIILYVDGIVYKTPDGTVHTMTLTVDDEGNLKTETVTVTGNATVGGKTGNQVDEVVGTIEVSRLTGSAVVVVKTEGGKTVEMTYEEYLEAKANGDDTMTLVGVLASTIPAPEDDDPVVTTPVINPVIPVINDIPPVVINDEQPPLEEAPDVEIPDEETPLDEAPDEVEIPEVEVPLSDVPLTGDNSYIWRTIALVSGLGLVWLALDKKREGSAE